MFIVWALLGALVAWPVLGALIGIAASLWKGFPVAYGIIGGLVLGPLAFLMFYGIAGDGLDSFDPSRTIVYYDSRFARRRCPECTGPNTSLHYHGTTRDTALEEAAGDFVLWGHFVPPAHRQITFTHRYKCIVCGYEWQFKSPHVDPDKPPIGDF